MTEFLLNGLALQKLEVVDQQHIDGIELVLEGQGITLPQGLNEAIHEALCRQHEHTAAGARGLDALGHGIEEMAFAKSRCGVNEKRVKAQSGTGLCLGDPAGCGMGQLVGGPNHKTVKGLSLIQRCGLVGDQ